MSAVPTNDVRFSCFMCRAIFDSVDDFAKHATITTHDYFVARED
jgi:hypothetical protein